MNKITPHHLSRSAYVYVRQSKPDQVVNNQESRRRQYALATRARALGWEDVIVIDDDLGQSGGGTARSGFERLDAATARNTKVLTGGSKSVAALIAWSERQDAKERTQDKEIRELRSRVEKLERRVG